MSKVSFFTPISYGKEPISKALFLLEAVDHYFYLGGRKAQVVRLSETETKAFLLRETPPLWKTCLKVISYFTLILPVLLLLIKMVLRSRYQYELDKSPVSPLCVDRLGLNLEEKSNVDFSAIFKKEADKYLPKEPITLKQATEEVISKINEAVLKKTSADLSPTEEKDVFFISTRAPWYKDGSNLYFYKSWCGAPSEPLLLNADERKKTWLMRIFQALSDKGLIELQERRHAEGYFFKVLQLV